MISVYYYNNKIIAISFFVTISVIGSTIIVSRENKIIYLYKKKEREREREREQNDIKEVV